MKESKTSHLVLVNSIATVIQEQNTVWVVPPTYQGRRQVLYRAPLSSLRARLRWLWTETEMSTGYTWPSRSNLHL